MGSVDKTLFLLKQGTDTLLVQIYVDDIIFGGSSHALVGKFAETMSREFEMSMMGELTFFLGLQIKQTREGTFVHQGKYTKDVLKKIDMGEAKPLSTPMSTTTALDADEEEVVDQKEYRSMIASLLYLTATRPDIQFALPPLFLFAAILMQIMPAAVLSFAMGRGSSATSAGALALYVLI
ncbi:uncharacterized protein LOC110431139 [Sorghum bicolor]|uniref:uncharacterized protein LOC110431139 n=1 Tax=Sorghum bicolor TaxID=4558 RepID=UPI000B424B36|nr:uncharacterized protein LOC110431139 [Sorghum bicolor]|eukprot:XP_021305523.1 uncharacterized protein LOC110431139 [Sorghum bicolor]